MKRLAAFFILALVLTAPLHAGQNFAAKKRAAVPIEPPAQTLRVGEKFVFDVFWLGIHVGTGELAIREKVMLRGREAFHVAGIARTNDFLSKLFPVHDEIHSWIDAENFHTLQFEKKISEGRYRADERIIYDYEQGKGFYESFKNGTKKEFPLNGPAHDIVSSFYWFRLQDVRGQKVVRTPINLEGDQWDLEVRVLGQETKELKGNRVLETFVVEPRTRCKGVFFKAGRAWVHFTVGPERTPVWVRFQTPFGPVHGILRS